MEFGQCSAVLWLDKIPEIHVSPIIEPRGVVLITLRRVLGRYSPFEGITPYEYALTGTDEDIEL